MEDGLRQRIYQELVRHNCMTDDAQCACGEQIPSLHPVFVTEYDWASHVTEAITGLLVNGTLFSR